MADEMSTPDENVLAAVVLLVKFVPLTSGTQFPDGVLGADWLMVFEPLANAIARTL